MVKLVLNGSAVEDTTSPADMTLLDWLRETRRLTGTKEGCAEGDCGACTVAIGNSQGWHAVNSCLALLGQADGCAVMTVEGLGTPATPHIVQKTLAEAHGTQCGFCTPGIVMSMFAFQQGGETPDESTIHEVLAGNLCRCTGYRPIVEAIRSLPAAEAVTAPAAGPAESCGTVQAPRTLAALHGLRARHPDAVLWAGGTDLGLLASKERRHFPVVITTAQVVELGGISVTDAHVEIGAAVTYARAQAVLDEHFPSFGDLLRRIGSRQIRNMGTLGGNLGTASPIGDTLPCLLALDATILLSGPGGSRIVGIDDYFTGYRKTARRDDEVIAAIRIPRLKRGERFVAYKVSKRFDQDISAVLGAYRLGAAPRLAYGGMAAVPQRAKALERVLATGELSPSAIAAAVRADFAPLSDHRASAEYRLTVAGNLLRRALAEEAGAVTRLELL
jgi:xanthine dehydrogenase small subunit